MSVIVVRWLPDARDGLKQVHRRFMYSMYEQVHTPDKKYVKSARVVGDVIGKYHPHGDQSVYDAMVRLAQDFSLRYPLVEGQGNFGNIDGDNAAAYRYTEARLTRTAIRLMAGLDEATGTFHPPYNGEDREAGIERLGNGMWQLVVSEIPYMVQKGKLIEQIATLIADKKLPILEDVRDESDEQIRLVLVPKSRNVDPELLKETLYRL